MFLRLTKRPSRERTRFGMTLVEFLVVIAIIGVIVAMLFPAHRGSREAGRRTQCKNNLKQIGLALHNYHDVYGAFPPAYTVDENGKPLHSWRTLILSYMDNAPLYARIDLTKPWDDPANAEAFKSRIMGYQCPSATFDSGQTGYTTYKAVVARGGCFNSQPRSIAEIKDGTSNTILVIEVESAYAVHWMSPLDADESQILSFDAKTKTSHSGGTHVLFADGTVRFLAAETSTSERLAMISIDGNDNE